MTGSVTSIGFSTYQTYANIVNNQKSVLNTSLRSATQATDSTCRGCNANNPATKALGHVCRVARRNVRKSSTLFAACSSTFVKWKPVGLTPYRLASNCNDSHVSGCQLPA